MKNVHAKQNNYRTLANKQKGATLFTALVFLTLMTLVSVTAAKVSIIDVLVAGNNQAQMLLYQRTARELDDFSRPSKLLEVLQNNDFQQAWELDLTSTTDPNTQEKITNRVVEYSCGAINGLATSQGTGNSCRLFDFEVRTQRPNTSVRDRHVRGVGKEYPSISRNNFNNY